MKLERLFKHVLILVVFIIIVCSWFVLNLLPFIIAQYIIFRIIELNTPIYLGATILTICDVYIKIMNGGIKQYFSDAKW